MKYGLILCIMALATAVMACTNETDNHQDLTDYTVGQKCPKQITYNGICDGNKVVFCNNNGTVEEIVCENKCLVKNAYLEPFAECYYECGDLDFKGKCVDDGFNYCHGTEGIIHITCDDGKTCGLKGDAYDCI